MHLKGNGCKSKIAQKPCQRSEIFLFPWRLTGIMKEELLTEISRKAHRWRQGPPKVTRSLNSLGSSSGFPGPSPIPSLANPRTRPSAGKQRKRKVQAMCRHFAGPREGPRPVQAPSVPHCAMRGLSLQISGAGSGGGGILPSFDAQGLRLRKAAVRHSWVSGRRNVNFMCPGLSMGLVTSRETDP